MGSVLLGKKVRALGFFACGFILILGKKRINQIIVMKHVRECDLLCFVLKNIVELSSLIVHSL